MFLVQICPTFSLLFFHFTDFSVILMVIAPDPEKPWRPRLLWGLNNSSYPLIIEKRTVPPADSQNENMFSEHILSLTKGKGCLSDDQILFPFHTHLLDSRLTFAISPPFWAAMCFNSISLVWKIGTENIT